MGVELEGFVIGETQVQGRIAVLVGENKDPRRRLRALTDYRRAVLESRAEWVSPGALSLIEVAISNAESEVVELPPPTDGD